MLTNRARTRYDTLANRLRREAGQSLAQSMKMSLQASNASEGGRRHTSVVPNSVRRLQGVPQTGAPDEPKRSGGLSRTAFFKASN